MSENSNLQNFVLDEKDKDITYAILRQCLNEKQDEAVLCESLEAAVRDEYERSLSYRVGKALCLHFR